MDLEIEKLALEITEYFDLHPNAADSIEGIVRWWLKKQENVVREELVLQAIEYLCETNVAIKSTGKSGKTIYSSAINIQ